MNKNKIFLCAISNISSGSCAEDCGFCTQSAKHHADIQRYRYKDIATIVEEAKRAKSNGAVGFCLVTSGVGLDDKKLSFVCEAAEAVKKEVEINLIACNGLATKSQIQTLKDSGVELYNHNLETSKEFYPSICSTHSWGERYETCLHVKDVGLKLDCGGIIGLGESEEDRVSFFDSIASLEPFSVPLNFFHPNEALPIKQAPVDEEEALEVIKYAREKLPNSRIMVAGGREITFRKNPAKIFEMGANSIIIGDYLTTSGEKAGKDLAMIKKAGYEIAPYCKN